MSRKTSTIGAAGAPSTTAAGVEACPLAQSQPRRMDLTRLQELMREQDGVVSRRQVLLCGGDDNDIECRLRSRQWATLHRGVYVDHTGVPSWTQRA